MSVAEGKLNLEKIEALKAKLKRKHTINQPRESQTPPPQNDSDNSTIDSDSYATTKEFEIPQDLNVNIPKEWRVDANRPAPKARDRYKRIEFDDPVAFSLYFDQQLATGATKFYDWQAFSLYLLVCPEFTIEHPLEFNLIASNGSGKDAYFIAKAATFLLACRIRARVVVTTKDFTQLSMQTFAYIAAFCEVINKRLLEDGFTDKKEFIKVRQGHITCEDTGSEIVLFVTDEAKRAEGYHPWNDHPDSELTIICNEAKSINDPIFQALRRCLGYKRFICVSSTGNRSGYFYREVQRSVKYPEPVQLGRPYARYVTSYECPHVSPAVIARDKEALEPWLFESIHESKFSSLEGSYVCPEELLMPAFILCRKTPPKDTDHFYFALDVSLGGDESVLLAARGNELLDAFDWRIRDNTILEPLVEREIKRLVSRYNLSRHNTTFNADAGGPGAPILNHLRRKIPLNITYVYNNGKANNKRIYGTSGAEDYFHIKQLITKYYIRAWSKWPKIIYQLALRQFEYRGSKIYLEHKAEAKARGEGSPDWADTLVLLWRRYRYTELNTVKPAQAVQQVPLPIAIGEDPDFDWETFSRERFKELDRKHNSGHTKVVSNTLNSYYGSNRRHKIFGR